MTDIFVLRNQSNAYFSKSGEWLSAGDSKSLYRSAFRDDIINEKVELTVKHPDLRIQAVAAQQAPNGRVLLNDEDILPKASSTEQENDIPEDDAPEQNILPIPDAMPIPLES